MIRLPGLIDTHVHLREPGATQKEDFESGTKAAIAGGYTVILDMPNNPEPTISLQALQKKISLAGPGSVEKYLEKTFVRGDGEEGSRRVAARSKTTEDARRDTKLAGPRTNYRLYCDVGFHFGASKESIQYFNQVSNKVWALKIYMNHTTGTLLIEDQKLLEKIFKSWPKEKVIMVHAEGKTLENAISLAKKFQKKLHVCHLSLKSQIEMVKTAKLEGQPVTCEVSAHHLFLTENDVKNLGPFGMMRPPLASKTDQQALWKNLDYIDTIASDHAPHTKEEKQQTPTPNGIPGLETTLPLLLTAVSRGQLSLGKLTDMTSVKPRLIFNIPNQENTYIEVDDKHFFTISNKNLFTKCGWTPFEGLRVKGKVMKVVLRGQSVFANGQFVINPSGKVIFPLV